MSGSAQPNTSINPQTDTRGVEAHDGPIGVGGAGPVSWEELESVTDVSKGNKDGNAKKDAGRSKTSDDQEAGKKSTDSGKKTEKKPGDQNVEEKEQQEDTKAASDKGKDASKTAKVYKVSVGGKPVEIPGDTVIEHKGQKVPFQELLNNYHGKVNYDKKFNEVAQERQKLERSSQEFHASVKELNSNIAQAYKIATEAKDPKALIHYIADLMGADPVQVWRTTKKSILEAAGVEADPDADVKEENEFYRTRDQREAERKKTKDSQDAANREIKARTDAVVKKYGMTDHELVDAYDAMVKDEQFKDKQITPEMIGEYHSQQKAKTLCEEIVDEMGEGLENSEKAVSLLIETKLKYPEFTKDDLKQIASEALGTKTSKVSKTLSKKVAQGNPTKVKPPAAKQKEDVTFFSDLD